MIIHVYTEFHKSTPKMKLENSLKIFTPWSKTSFILQSDNETFNEYLGDFLLKKGILHNCKALPQQKQLMVSSAPVSSKVQI